MTRTTRIACAVLIAASAAQAGQGTTTTTTTTAASTTTTIFGGCAVAATFESILCRLDALEAWIESSSELGRMKAGLAATAGNARDRCGRAQASTGRTVSNQLKRCSKTLASFRHRVGSLIGRKVIAKDVRDLLREEIAGPLRDDVSALRRTL